MDDVTYLQEGHHSVWSLLQVVAYLCYHHQILLRCRSVFHEGVLVDPDPIVVQVLALIEYSPEDSGR